MKSFLGRSFLGIVRSSTLIGPDGRIERLWPAVKAKGHAAEVLAEVKELAGQTPNS
jgi:peroxiredoxin Q/BCP